MQFDLYQIDTRGTAVYPGANEGTKEALSYLVLGLAGEAGEVANNYKKWLRDGSVDIEGLLGELGDVLWYAARLADELEVTLSVVAENNLMKLWDRQSRGKLKGAGDGR